MRENIAVVTGGTGGIGKACAALFVSKGWRVYTLSRHGGPEDKNLIHLVCDITDTDSVKRAVASVIQAEGHIDCMVCNAGFGISGAIEFTKPEDAQRLFDVNLFGGLRCAQAVIPAMRREGQGKIIFTSSVAAVMPIPFQGFYSSTKAAINMMAGALANEVRDFGIGVCCVMPGDVKTGFTAAREKSFDGEEIYGGRIEKSVAVMEHDEATGMEPEAIAAVICHAAEKKHVKPLYTPGFLYKCCVVLGKILPARLVYFILNKMYVKK